MAPYQRAFLRQNETFPRPKSSHFGLIEITLISVLNVSSQPWRRNNSFAHETIFPFSRRHPETLIN
jgi:hypothetical protein